MSKTPERTLYIEFSPDAERLLADAGVSLQRLLTDAGIPGRTSWSPLPRPSPSPPSSRDKGGLAEAILTAVAADVIAQLLLQALKALTDRQVNVHRIALLPGQGLPSALSSDASLLSREHTHVAPGATDEILRFTLDSRGVR